jgi:hypothetical protein
VDRFSKARGTAVAIAFVPLDVERSRTSDYLYATYDGGKTISEILDFHPVSIGDRSTDGLIEFLRQYVGTSSDHLVVTENWFRCRNDAVVRRFESRIAFCQNDIYHFLLPGDVDADLIESSFREPWHNWFCGVCASNIVPPHPDRWPVAFINEIAQKTEHVFVPAFDGEGFLIWSPSLASAEVNNGDEKSCTDND